jgi:hypothetical protein
MPRSWIWYVAKGLQGLGLVIVLVGVVISMQLGFGDEGLSSMKAEFYGLAIGGGCFVAGWMIARSIGAR